jgi:hypothetical protein
MNSYVYRGKSIPKMSGYQTAILVHKEGIMTNEDIYKYADKKYEVSEIILVSLLYLGFLGILLIGATLLFISDVLAVGVTVMLVAEVIFVWYRQMSKWARNRRNYIYNLVRADERKRCMTERYKHEGSK